MTAKFVVFRWLILIPAAFAGSYIAAFIGISIEYIGLRLHYGLIGALISFSFIVSGAYVAPSHKLFSASVLFLVGVIISWEFLYGRTKTDSITPDYIPMIATYSSGVLACVLIFYWIQREKSSHR